VDIAPVPEVNVITDGGRMTPRFFDWLNKLRDAVLLLRYIHIVRGSPNGAEIGSVGHLALRVDGGASTTLYVKESGNQTNTGWRAV
jgi:hypothetical protein